MDNNKITLFLLYVFRLLCVKAGHIVDGVDVDAYLTRYHYMGKDNPDPRISSLMDTDPDEARRVGLSMYQMMWGLTVTGRADEETLAKMRMPRCGLPDVDNEEDMPNMVDVMGSGGTRRSRRRRYALEGSKWPKTALTYKISQYTDDTDPSNIDRDIEAAFRVWADVTPLSFTRVGVNDEADIDVSFVPLAHGDGYDFDGPEGTLAHAFYPRYGGASHFDESETWTVDTTSGVNIFQVAAHEFGHALGLRHSMDIRALMYPYYLGYIQDFTLPEDDINGIQAIYGRNDMPVMPTYDPTPYVPPTMPPQMPDVCRDGRFDAVTVQYIEHHLFTVTFKDDYYMLLNDGGLVEGYPKMIADDWEGVTSVDAALTRYWEYSDDSEEWLFKRVTYLFSGSQYYKFIDRQLQPGYPRSIESEWGLPSDLDAIFEWGGNGKIYSFKGSQYYRHSRMGQATPDMGYPRPLSIWGGNSFTRVDAVFLSNDRSTHFFTGNQHYRFNDRSFSVDSGYPKDNRLEWLGCEAGGIYGDGGSGLDPTLSLVLFAALVVLLRQ